MISIVFECAKKLHRSQEVSQEASKVRFCWTVSPAVPPLQSPGPLPPWLPRRGAATLARWGWWGWQVELVCRAPLDFCRWAPNGANGLGKSRWETLRWVGSLESLQNRKIGCKSSPPDLAIQSSEFRILRDNSPHRIAPCRCIQQRSCSPPSQRQTGPSGESQMPPPRKLWSGICAVCKPKIYRV